MKNSWTDDDFRQMSWHDNAVHGIRIIEGQYGFGEFVLDIDYILEWLPRQDHEGGLRFRIAPAELRFHETTDLKIALDYASATAALTPFSIHQIQSNPSSMKMAFAPGGGKLRSIGRSEKLRSNPPD